MAYLDTPEGRAKARAQRAAWAAANPEKVKASRAKWSAANPGWHRDPEAHRVEANEYYHAHREEALEKQRLYREAHREEMSERHRGYYAKRRDAAAVHRAEYARSDSGRAAAAEYRRLNADKWKARDAVRHGVAEGRIVKPPCEICGSTTAIQGHHAFGYSEDMKLAVWWLCPPHHGGMHAAIRGV